MNRITDPHRTVEIQWHPLRVPGSWNSGHRHEAALEAFVQECVNRGCEVVHDYIPTILGNEYRLRIHIPLNNLKIDQVAMGKELQKLFGAEKLLHK